MTTLCENLGEGKFRECCQLYQWTTSIPLPRPYLKQPAFWAPNKFQGFCKFSIAPSNELLAVASPGGDLLIFARKDEEVALKYQLTITPDDHPEYTLLEWSASESLVLASRTDATVIVVEATGSFCYEVPMYDELRNARKLITQIRSASSDDPDFVDLLYVLQIDGCLTGVKLG